MAIIELTYISVYSCRGKADRVTVSSSGALSSDDALSDRSSSRCALAGIPVIGSSRVLKWARVHAGETLRSDSDADETTLIGISAAVRKACAMMADDPKKNPFGTERE